MSARVQLDQNICISSGKCVADAPTAFEFDEDEIAMVKPGEVTLPEAELRAIADNCPSGAIKVLSRDTQER